MFMTALTPLLAVLLALFFSDVFAQAERPTDETQQRFPNVVLICIDDLRPELACFGVPHIHSPNIDKLAANGRAFTRHYVQAPTCGASRYTLLIGMYGPVGNDAFFQRAKRLADKTNVIPPSMPEWFRNSGYRTHSVGKVSHHPGGLGGPDWNDESVVEIPNAWDRQWVPGGKWQHPRGVMHGLANGEIRGRAQDMALFQAVVGEDSVYPDGHILEQAKEAVAQLTSDESEAPFFLAVGFLKPHLPLGAPSRYLDLYRDVKFPSSEPSEKPSWRTTWHGSQEFMKYQRWGRDPRTDPEFAEEVRRHYAACVSYSDALVGELLSVLWSRVERENTIVVLWGDHGWHLGEHSIWGKHSLFEESLRSPLIISSPNIQQQGHHCSAIVESIDVFPTLCDLAGLKTPDFCHGQSLKSYLDDPAAMTRKPAVSYMNRLATVRTPEYRLIRHPDGYVELYNHGQGAGETKNIADSNPEVVQALSRTLQDRLQLKNGPKQVPQ